MTPWSQLTITGGEPVIHFHGTTEARDAAVAKSNQEGVSSRKLLGRNEACQTAAGEYDIQVTTPDGTRASEWINRQTGVDSGVTLSTAHTYLEDYNSGELPCAPCDAKIQYEGIPRDANDNPTVDVIHATHQFAYVPSLVHNANVFIDEQPDFGIDVSPTGQLTQQRIQDMVAAWLNQIGAPVTSWESFVVRSRDGHTELREVVKADHHVDSEWFIQVSDAHTLAPALTEALYKALSSSPDINGRHSAWVHNDMARFSRGGEDDVRFSQTRVTVVIDQDNSIRKIWNVPDLGNARSLICLDAWPSIPEFNQNIGPNLTKIELLDERERKGWRRFQRGLEVVQIGRGEAARPAGSDYAVENYFNPDEVRVVIEWLRTLFGDAFRSVIAPKKIEEQVQAMMQDAGIQNPEEWTMHQGEEKSREDFSGESVGLVTNCIDPGDDYVLDLLAARDLSAKPATAECLGCGGRGCEKCNYDGEHRLPGREFEGPDAERATEILNGIRANHTNQAVGRYARQPNHPDNGAIVFVRTSTVDESLVDRTIPDPWVFGDKQRAAVNYLRETPNATAKETREGIEPQFDAGVTKQSVRDTFLKLIECGVAERSEGTGAYGADEFRLTSPVPEHGLLKYPELNSRESPNDP